MNKSQRHLADSEMTYWYHLCHSLINSGRLLVLAFTSFVHAFVPQVWPTHAARGVITIYNRMRQHRHLRRLQMELKDSAH